MNSKLSPKTTEETPGQTPEENPEAAKWSVIKQSSATEKQEDKTPPLFDENRPITEEEELRYKDRLQDIAERDHLSPNKKTAEAEKKAMVLYYNIELNKNLILPSIIQADSETINSMANTFKFFSDQYSSLENRFKTKASRETYDEIITHLLWYYNTNTNNPQILDSIIKRTNLSLTKTNNWRDINNIKFGIQTAYLSDEPNAFDLYCDAAEELNSAKDSRLPDYWRLYCTNHGIRRNSFTGYQKNVIPMIMSHDPDVENLQESSNSWVTAPYFGISDYTIHALTLEVNPKNTRDLMQIYREIPTSDYAKFEQNRQDALALMGVLWGGRDFIHDERPGIHELFSAMIDYYDSRNNDNHHLTEQKLHQIVDERLNPQNDYHYSGFDGQKCFDFQSYERFIDKTVYDGPKIGKHYHEKAIDILRNLEKNTRSFSLETPKTNDPTLNDLLAKLTPYEDQNGQIIVDLNQISSVAARANQLLISSQNQIGLRPSLIKALSYIEKMSTFALRNIDSKTYRELPFDPGFKEICRFNELTSSGNPYNASEFETFWNTFLTSSNQAWPDQVQNAYSLLAQRTINQVNDLAKQYTRENAPRYMIDSLWSGNLSRELIGLAH